MKFLGFLTAFFPHNFRKQYAPEICRDIQEMHQDILKSQGKMAANLYLMRAATNVLQVALFEHWQQDLHMLRTQPATLIPAVLLAGLTITGVLAYGQFMVNMGEQTVGLLGWMNPGVTTREVTSEAKYRPLVQAIEEVYHPSSVKIMEFQRNQGGLKGGFWDSSRVLWVSVVSPQLGKEVKTSLTYASKRDETRTRRNLLKQWISVERTKVFKQQMQEIVNGLKASGFDAWYFCAASPAVTAVARYKDQPGSSEKVKVYGLSTVTMKQAEDQADLESADPHIHLYDAHTHVWYLPYLQGSYSMEFADDMAQPCDSPPTLWDDFGKLIM